VYTEAYRNGLVGSKILQSPYCQGIEHYRKISKFAKRVMCGELDHLEDHTHTHTHSKETTFPSDKEINKGKSTIFGRIGGSISKSAESIEGGDK